MDRANGYQEVITRKVGGDEGLADWAGGERYCEEEGGEGSG